MRGRGEAPGTVVPGPYSSVYWGGSIWSNPRRSASAQAARAGGRVRGVMAATRIEKDTFGPIEVPADRLWGAQTQRSLQNFAISGERMPTLLLHSLATVKKAAALVNQDLGTLEPKLAEAIVRAADEVAAGQHDDHFPLVVWQTGSGTQSNMNMNEVVANRASELLGGPRGEERLVHPNDHVNRGQSSNDVFPAAMSLACTIALRSRVIPAVRALREVLAEKAT